MTGTDILTEANDLVLIRRFNAPRALVWRAWTDPERLEKWWGPEGFACRCEMEVREGAAYRWTMVGPAGTDYAGDYPITGIFLEILPEQSIALSMSVREHDAAWHDVIRTGWEAELGRSGGLMSDCILARVNFEAAEAGTRLIVRQSFVDAAMRDAHLKLGAKEGWSMSFDKLDKLLGGL